jgi:hypothetical protein
MSSKMSNNCPANRRRARIKAQSQVPPLKRAVDVVVVLECRLEKLSSKTVQQRTRKCPAQMSSKTSNDCPANRRRARIKAQQSPRGSPLPASAAWLGSAGGHLGVEMSTCSDCKKGKYSGRLVGAEVEVVCAWPATAAQEVSGVQRAPWRALTTAGSRLQQRYPAQTGATWLLTRSRRGCRRVVGERARSPVRARHCRGVTLGNGRPFGAWEGQGRPTPHPHTP